MIIRHLHGKAHPNEAPSPLILTEADYFSAVPKLRWGAEFMRSRLDGSTALFVGTSLSDPNLFRYLHSQADFTTPRHIAIFRRASPSGDPAVTAFERSTAMKWAQVGVATLQSDFYSQTAQFLHELRLVRNLGDKYVPYSARLRMWAEDMDGWIHDPTPAPFRAHQDLIQTALVNLVETLVATCAANSIHLKVAESLEAEIWSRRPSIRSLTLVGSSAALYRSAATMPSVSLLEDMTNPVVSSFQSGVRMLHELPPASSQRRTMMTIPILHDDHPRYGRLTVGVLAVSSNMERTLSILDRLRFAPPAVRAMLEGKDSHALNLLDSADYGAV
jgi:hypothetical protein